MVPTDWPHVTDGKAEAQSGGEGAVELGILQISKDRHWRQMAGAGAGCLHAPSTRPWTSFCPPCASVSSSTQWEQSQYLPPRAVGMTQGNSTRTSLSVGRLEGTR